MCIRINIQRIKEVIKFSFKNQDKKTLWRTAVGFDPVTSGQPWTGSGTSSELWVSWREMSQTSSQMDSRK